jgi:hypothetical protein
VLGEERAPLRSPPQHAGGRSRPLALGVIPRSRDKFLS